MHHSVFAVLPASLHQLIRRLPDDILRFLEEIRVREARPLEIVYRGRYGFVCAQGAVLDQPFGAYHPSRDDCLKLLDLLTNHSMYTLDEQLKRGYITIRGGHRVGFAGRTVLEQGKVKQIKDISSFNIRIAREVRNAGSSLLPYLLDRASHRIHHTLIVSPPLQGKTTLIRDLARLISCGDFRPPGIQRGGFKVGIVDERSEIAACVKGIPHFDVGPRTDVLDSCPKAEGMMMMIRSMSPDVLIVDEIGTKEDAAAIHEAIHAGIRVVATAHGNDLADIRRRPMLAGLLERRVFSRFVLLGKSQGPGTIEHIYDEHGARLEMNLHRKAGG